MPVVAPGREPQNDLGGLGGRWRAAVDSGIAMSTLFRPSKLRGRAAFALAAVCVVLGLVFDAAAEELALATIACVGIALHRDQRCGYPGALLVLVGAAIAVTAVVMHSVRAAFAPFGLADFAPASTIAFLLTAVAPLAGSMTSLAAPRAIAGRAWWPSLLIAYGGSTLCAFAALLAGSLASVGMGVLAGEDRGIIVREIHELVVPGPSAAVAMVALPLVTWAGVRINRTRALVGSWPLIHAAAAAVGAYILTR